MDHLGPSEAVMEANWLTLVALHAFLCRRSFGKSGRLVFYHASTSQGARWRICSYLEISEAILEAILGSLRPS